MKVLSYLNVSDTNQLTELNSEELPFQFLKDFTHFYKNYFHENINMIYHERLDAYIPLRLNRAKLFAHAQVMHAPVNAKTHEELSPKDQHLFFNALIRFLKESNLCQRLIQPQPYGILGALPPNVQSCEFGTYIIDLANQTEEEIFEKFHPKYQKAILHSQKHGAIVKFGREVFQDFYKTYSSTMQRVNMEADPIQYFLNLYAFLGEDHITPGVVYDQDTPIGSVFTIHTQYAGYCTHAGSQGTSKLYGAMKLLHFEMMKRLKLIGVKRYDLVGVRLKNKNPALEGIFHFKKGFGGELKTGYLWKMDIHPLKSKLYDTLLLLKHGSKKIQKDIIDQVNEEE